MITIREIREGDAQNFLQLCRRLDEETQFMLLEPGERRITVEEQRQRIVALLAHKHQTILVAENESQLVGYLAAIGSDYRRNRHSVYLGTGIRQAFTGQGIGTQLFMALEQWARERDLHRLELTVMVHNERAIGLYKKMGFEIEGVKRHSLVVKGAYVDEYYMAKLLA